MDDETPIALEDFVLGARFLSMRDFESDGEEWTEFALDNGFILQISGRIIIVTPRPN
jgi:hypothetical protein